MTLESFPSKSSKKEDFIDRDRKEIRETRQKIEVKVNELKEKVTSLQKKLKDAFNSYLSQNQEKIKDWDAEDKKYQERKRPLNIILRTLSEYQNTGFLDEKIEDNLLRTEKDIQNMAELTEVYIEDYKSQSEDQKPEKGSEKIITSKENIDKVKDLLNLIDERNIDEIKSFLKTNEGLLVGLLDEEQSTQLKKISLALKATVDWDESKKRYEEGDIGVKGTTRKDQALGNLYDLVYQIKSKLETGTQERDTTSFKIAVRKKSLAQEKYEKDETSRGGFRERIKKTPKRITEDKTQKAKKPEIITKVDLSAFNLNEAINYFKGKIFKIENDYVKVIDIKGSDDSRNFVVNCIGIVPQTIGQDGRPTDFQERKGAGGQLIGHTFSYIDEFIDSLDQLQPFEQELLGVGVEEVSTPIKDKSYLREKFEKDLASRTEFKKKGEGEKKEPVVDITDFEISDEVSEPVVEPAISQKDTMEQVVPEKVDDSGEITPKSKKESVFDKLFRGLKTKKEIEAIPKIEPLPRAEDIFKLKESLLAKEVYTVFISTLRELHDIKSITKKRRLRNQGYADEQMHLFELGNISFDEFSRRLDNKIRSLQPLIDENEMIKEVFEERNRELRRKMELEAKQAVAELIRDTEVKKPELEEVE